MLSARLAKTAGILAAIAGIAQAQQYLISFGDSYSQTGFDPNGAHPSSSNPLGNPAYPGYTASGGANWVGYLIEDYNNSTLLSYNFAYGGATVDAALVAPYTPTVKSFIDQVGQFNSSIASHPSYAPWTGANSLFAVWLGVNDVGNSWYTSGVDTLIPKIMDQYFNQLNTLYNAGARNFALLSVPPIEKTPLMVAQGASDQASEAAVIAQFNSLLSQRLQTFLASHNGTFGVLVDTQTPFNTAIADPTAYGSPDATCYNADGKSCLWFNNYHPGLAINNLVAAQVAKTWNGTSRFFHL